jgi:hypothetical protein
MGIAHRHEFTRDFVRNQRDRSFAIRVGDD